MHTETLTIGGLMAEMEYENDATHSQVFWDGAHRQFVGRAALGRAALCRLRVRSGLAPEAAFAELRADGRLWTLRRDRASGRQRIAIHGCPMGPLTMTLDLESAARSHAPRCGTLFLGPVPPGQQRIPLGYPLMPLLWTLLLGDLGVDAGGLLCHACGIVTPAGEGLLFCGFSGAGKSTTSRLWRAACPDAAVLSDDRTLLRRDPSSPSGFAIHGTPWHGDAEEAARGSAPLSRILILGRSPDGVRSEQIPLSPGTGAAQVFARATPPIWDAAGTAAALALAADACAAVPTCRWDFAPTPAAICGLSPNAVPPGAGIHRAELLRVRGGNAHPGVN